MFLLGMGSTGNTVDSGAAASLRSSGNADGATAHVTLKVAMRYLLLLPDSRLAFVGLYQLNLQIPLGTPGGNTVVGVSQNGVARNTAILPIGY